MSQVVRGRKQVYELTVDVRRPGQLPGLGVQVGRGWRAGQNEATVRQEGIDTWQPSSSLSSRISNRPRVGANQGVRTISAAELEKQFAALGASAPSVVAWPQDLPRWHLERAAVAESAKNWFTALFHFKRLAALKPDDISIKRRLETARGALEAVPPAPAP